jgi:hypothetical protein
MSNLADLPRESRRVILVADRDTLRSARRNPDLVDYLDSEEAAVIEIPGDLGTGDPLVQRLSRENRLVPGTLLVQSPYDIDRYEAADDAVAEFAVAKFMLLTEICQKLGAESVDVDNLKTESREHHVEGDLKIKTPVQSFEASTVYSEEQRIRDRLELHDTFRGGPPDVEVANKVLAAAGLQSDTELTSLIALRAGDNTLVKRTIRLSLTKESSQNLRVAAKWAGFKLSNVSSNFAMRVHQNNEVILAATITFPH